MKIFYQAVLHITNLFFLAVLGVIMVAVLSNPSSSEIPSPNGVTSGIIFFLAFLWLLNYLFQIIKGGWITLLIGHLIYIIVFCISLFVLTPFLIEKIYY